MAWFCFNDGFVSAVESDDPKLLMVRARSDKHLKNIFGKDVKVKVTPQNDYRFRTFCTREQWADIVSKRILDINYSNFKDSVKEDALHEMYAEFWTIHWMYQKVKAGFQKKYGG